MKLHLFLSNGLTGEQAHLFSVPQKWLNPISPKEKVGKLHSAVLLTHFHAEITVRIRVSFKKRISENYFVQDVLKYEKLI